MTNEINNSTSVQGPEFDDMVARLDRLGAFERGSTDAEFESRIVASVENAIHAPAGRISSTSRSWMRDPFIFAAAASVVLVAGISFMLWSSGRGAPMPEPGVVIAASDPASEVEEWVTTVAWLNEDLADFSDLKQAAAGLRALDDEGWELTPAVLLETEESN